MILRNTSIPEVLEPYIDDLFERFAKLEPATRAVKQAIDKELAIKAEIAAAFVVVWHEAKRTRTWQNLYDSFKTAKGATEQAKFINYLTEARLANDRMNQAVNEMASVLAVVAPRYTLIDEPTVGEVLAEITRLGTVAEIHNQYEQAERERLAREATAETEKKNKRDKELADSRGLTLEQFREAERKEKQREQQEKNEPSRRILLEKIRTEAEVLGIKINAPGPTVLVAYQGQVLKLSPEQSLTFLDAVAVA